MRCRKCGQELAEDSVFCSNCGTPVSGKNKGYIVVAAIVSLVIIAGIATLYATIHVNNTKEQVTSEEKSKTVKKKSNNKKQTKKKEDTKAVQKDNSTSNSYQKDDSIKNQAEDPTGGEYIIADSATRLLTTSDIQGLTARELNYAKNEIYARHGRKFDSQELRNYFESKSWYVEKYEGSVFDTNYSDQLLSDIEKKNAEFLKDAENRAQNGGYQLDQ